MKDRVCITVEWCSIPRIERGLQPPKFWPRAHASHLIVWPHSPVQPSQRLAAHHEGFDGQRHLPCRLIVFLYPTPRQCLRYIRWRFRSLFCTPPTNFIFKQLPPANNLLVMARDNKPVGYMPIAGAVRHAFPIPRRSTLTLLSE